MFNVNKYQLVHYSNDQTFQGIYHNDIFIPVSTDAIHLGNPIGPNSANRAVDSGINSFLVSFNVINSLFSRASTHVRLKLFKAYCMSLYGSVLWDLSCKAMNVFYTQWRKVVRKCLNISNLTHSRFLAPICNDKSIECQLYLRFINFLNTLLQSKNKCINLCLKLVLNGSGSIVSQNLASLAYKLKVNRNSLINNVKLVHTLDNELTDEDEYKITSICEILKICDNNSTDLSYCEWRSLLDYFCVN